ncbi:TetR family transcriptional regulator [Luteimonas sp. BDR2-5]|uniref:TetR family transcriptional regulator n=1 Tax=Proluteimonas luteida TaxID=2878685 RepID=UPI001E3A10E2|nr:TetR family transcriptional regulator [Luteimonas sp. BDR2-5]
MARHALGEDEKEARRNLILAAALELFLDDTRRLPPVALIAAKAGLAKGTLYLYFDSKEQIFTSLLSREWDDLFSVVTNSFAPAAGGAAAQAATFIGDFVTFLEGRPYFLRLDALGYALLEANLPLEQLRPFKRTFSDALIRAGSVVDAALALPAGRGIDLLVRSYALTRGLWQIADYPDHLRRDQDLSGHPIAQLEFGREIGMALGEYWRGALPNAE